MNSILGLLLLAGSLTGVSCKDGAGNDPVPDIDGTPAAAAGFACGADVSWLTQMEAEGLKFHVPDFSVSTSGAPAVPGEEMECMQLLRDHCGVNSIRLRVWVNPEDGWNNVDDVVVKALRAHRLGMRLMIDFHFSDTWADPGHQLPPVAWQNYSLEEMAAAVGEHVHTVLSRLKAVGVTPEWVQVGNETTPGMMLPMGSIENPVALTRLNNAGYDAVKDICPEALVIVHLDGGNNQGAYDRMFDLLETNGGRYDMIGMSVYPYWAEQEGYAGGWRKIADECVANISHLRGKYGKPVMICEIGMPWDHPEECAELISCMMKTPVEGIFYWEPQAPAGYNDGYTLGCFADSAPTIALTPFLKR